MGEKLLVDDETKARYRPSINQAMFVRDDVHHLVTAHVGVSGERRFHWRRENPVRVIAAHTSKGIALGVYRIAVPDLTLTLRNNFYDWKVSVESSRPVDDAFFDLIDRDEVILPVYCEGFPEEYVYGPYSADPSKFTVAIHGDFVLWTFLYLLMQGTVLA
jgi:hypothetical protein